MKKIYSHVNERTITIALLILIIGYQIFLHTKLNKIERITRNSINLIEENRSSLESIKERLNIDY